MLPLLAQIQPQPKAEPTITPDQLETINKLYSPYGGVTADSLEAVRNTARGSAKVIDNLWINLVHHQSPYYQGVIKALLPMVAVAFLFWAVKFGYEAFARRDIHSSLQQFVWAMIVVILFTFNNGKHMATLTYTLKYFFYSINDSILDSTVAGIHARSAIISMQLRTAYEGYLSQEIKACDSLSEAKEDNGVLTGPEQARKSVCYDQAEKKAADTAANYINEKLSPVSIDQKDYRIAGIRGRLRSAARATISGLLMSFSFAAYFGFAYIVALIGLTGPLWLSITLLPMRTRGLMTFISLFFGACMIVITYSLLVAACAVSLLPFSVGDPLLFPLIAGLFAPAIAVMLGSGAGVAMFSGMMRVQSAAMRAPAQLVS